jgi:hypothetical protein
MGMWNSSDFLDRVHLTISNKMQEQLADAGRLPANPAPVADSAPTSKPATPVLQGELLTQATIDALPFPSEAQETYSDGSIVVGHEKNGYRVVATNHNRSELQHVKTSAEAFALVEKYWN